jgi:glycosyltransferase involved in cell wall biosynthesis
VSAAHVPSLREGAPAHQPAPAPRPLRLLQVVEAFSTGVFEVVRQIANAASARGYEVHVAHSQRPLTPPEFASLFADGIIFHRLRWELRRPWPLLASAGQLATLTRQGRFDVIHLHGTFAGVTGALTRPRNVPVVYTPHGYAFLMRSLPTPARRAARATERVVGRMVSVVGAVSNSEAAEARRLGLRRVWVVHNGIPELDDIAARPPANAGRCGVVAAGRMSAQRQPLQVAEIFRLIKHSSPKTWIGDRGDERAALALSRSGALITGWQPRERVLELVGDARVYVHWTAWDGHPLSILEAFAMGTVAVAHDIPPAREILGERWVHRDVRSAAQMIDRLLTDEDFYAVAQQDQARRAARYSARAMTDGWCRLYAELASM